MTRPGDGVARGDDYDLLSQPHLNLRLEADAGEAADKILRDVAPADKAVSVLYSVASQLLQVPSTELMRSVLNEIFSLVPGAQRISLVGWPVPVGDDGVPEFKHLVPPLLHPVFGRGGAAISRSLMQRAVDSRQALLFSHAQDSAGLASAASIMAQSIRSAVYVPLFAQDRSVLGVLCVDTPQPWRPFDVQDFQFIRALAAMLAASLDAERLRARARNQEREARDMAVRREAMTSFLKIATHDLKGPIAVIKMVAQEMADDGLPDTAMYVDYLQRAVRRAQSLVDTYLQACEVDTGKPLTLVPECVDPRQIVDEEIALVRDVLFSGTSSRFQFVNEVSCIDLVADADKLRQVFANLISNACKYSPDGGVILVRSVDERTHVRFLVTDAGVGISQEDQARLFQQFQRVGDRALATGSGLGLWLVHALVQAHGGTLGVESALGDGSTFFFSVARGLAAPIGH